MKPDASVDRWPWMTGRYAAGLAELTPTGVLPDRPRRAAHCLMDVDAVLIGTVPQVGHHIAQ